MKTGEEKHKESVISVNSIIKTYQLYNKPSDRLVEAISGKSRHQTFCALDNVSFEVNRGECVGIIGQNGSGKSTLLKIITGVLQPSLGSITLHGKVSALLELGAGFNPEYTGLENIFLNGTMMGYSRQEMEKKVDEIVAFADIGDFIHQPVKTYSSGMFVRLAFAVSINVDPDILIVDEALSVGDVFFQLKCFKKFEEFRKSGKTLLFVSHDMGSIIKYCSRCICLEHGKIIGDGETKRIVDIFKKSTVGLLDLPPATDGNNAHNNFIEQIKKNSGQEDLWKKQLTINDALLEYGDKSAIIEDFGIFTDEGVVSSTITKNSWFTIVMKIRFFEHVESPIYAFAFKDIKGFEVTGTNTMLERIDVSPRGAGDVFVVRFRQQMTLQNGQYFLSLGCTKLDASGNLQVCHRLYDVCALMILATKSSNGYFDMNSEITIECIAEI